jgi:hypothetical protein
MTAVRALQEEFANIGYIAIVRDYVFSDIFSASTPNRKVPVAAFTHTPHSYRNAALAVVEGNQRPASEIVSEYRALGAPLLFVVEGNEVVVWQVRSGAPPQEIARSHVNQLTALFSQYRESWSPLSIQRAKSIGQFDPHYQLSFVDLGLLPAIEGEIHSKLDHLLNRALAQAIDPRTGRPRRINERVLFRAVFRFLAAKVLQDRSHPIADTWDMNKIETVLDEITRYYGLPPLSVQPSSVEYRVFTSVWECIRGGINFQNISADDLAFVYENTLVTEEIRKAFGTHNTPRQVAEYIACHLGFHEYANAPEQLRVYEPFAGAAVLLISALRHLRELLPVTWTDRQRHEFLITHVSGDELDAFACEVAMLSLILADYPNHNGWRIAEENLFKDGVLGQRMRDHSIILCNPPFEAFSPKDRAQFSIARSVNTKAMAVLNAALDAHPLALGFVLPRAFILDRQFADQRRRLEKLYGDIELVEVPDRIFRYSQVESALLIARERRPPAPPLIKLRSTEIADRDGKRFLQTGEITKTRTQVRDATTKPSGDLWIRNLASLWAYLKPYPRLGDFLRPSWGLQWTYNQTEAFSDRREPGFRRGLSRARHLKQFKLNQPQWLDYRRDFVRRGYGQEWHRPKLVLNEGRLSRGAWRIGAALDTQGLLYSQQFFGLWPTADRGSEKDMLAFLAILNGPVANAFIAIHSPAKGIRATAVGNIPIPYTLPNHLSELVFEYSSLLNEDQIMHSNDARLAMLLTRIDAAVLEAYDLPPRMERELLEFFIHEKRPVDHAWEHWLPERFEPFIPLHEFVSEQYQKATQPWTQEVFKPLPPEEAEALREYMD